jgi:tetratricopeptide (TPR) repeat protein
MSLIHNALKKLEAMEYGDPPENSTFGTLSWAYRYRGFLAFFLVLISFLLFIFLYLSSEDNPLESVALERVTPSTDETASEGTNSKGMVGSNTASTTEGSHFVEGGVIRAQEGASLHNEKGVHLFKTGKLRAALKEFRAAEALKPESPELYNNLGLTLLELDETAQAEGAFKKALELRPDYAEALNNYGALQKRRGSPQRALSLFKKAINLDPSYPDPHLNIAITLERLGRYGEARSHYESFLKKNGGDELLRKEVMKKTSQLRSQPILKTR